MNKKIAILVSTVALVVLVAGFIYFQSNTPVEPTTADGITNLHDFSQMREAFESDSGYVRLISLLSPV